jgi:hypothetical protein
LKKPYHIVSSILSVGLKGTGLNLGSLVSGWVWVMVLLNGESTKLFLSLSECYIFALTHGNI